MPDGAERAGCAAPTSPTQQRVERDDDQRAGDEGDLVVLAEGPDRELLDRLRRQRDGGVADRDDRGGRRARRAPAASSATPRATAAASSPASAASARAARGRRPAPGAPGAGAGACSDVVTPVFGGRAAIRIRRARHFLPRRPVTGRRRRGVCQAGAVPTAVPAPDGARRRRCRPSARVAVVLMGVLAALLLLYAALTWLRPRRASPRPWSARGPTSREAEAARYVLRQRCCRTSSRGRARRLPPGSCRGGSRWARWTGLAASCLLAGLMLLGMASIGGVTPISLLRARALRRGRHQPAGPRRPSAGSRAAGVRRPDRRRPGQPGWPVARSQPR